MAQALNELFSDRQLKRDADSLKEWGCDWTRSFEVAPVCGASDVANTESFIASRTEIGSSMS